MPKPKKPRSSTIIVELGEPFRVLLDRLAEQDARFQKPNLSATVRKLIWDEHERRKKR